MKKMISGFILATLLTAGIILYVEYRLPKVYYVDIRKVYDEFELKKELEGKLQSFISTSNTLLDSLELQAGRTDPGSPAFGSLQQLYAARNEQFSAQGEQLTAQYDEQVWAQLNQYMQQYASEKRCDFLLGGNGDGSIMYAHPKKDITNEMITYVNGKYNGR